MFKLTPLYIKIYRNKIEVTNLTSGNTISLDATSKFSSERIVINSFSNTEVLLRDILKELGLVKRFFSPRLQMLMQIVENLEGGLSDMERRCLRDLAEQAGAVSVYLLEHNKILSVEEAKLNFIIR